jgi:integrase
VKAAPNKRKITPLDLKKVKPGARPFMVWDALQRGLGLRVEPTGYKAWKVVYRRHNRPRWFHLGATDALGLADARKMAAKVMSEVLQGGDPQTERKAERLAGTFAQMAERYRDDHAKRKNKSWKQADALVRKYLLPHWAKLNPKAIMRADVRAAIGKIEAPILANQVLTTASAIFSWAVKEEIVPFNPCRGIERNPTKSRERVLSDAELPLFWSAFDETGLLRSSALKVLLLLGQRPGEISHMRWEHLSPDGWWELPGAPEPKTGWPGTKNGQTHKVYLPIAARAIIDLLRDDDGKCGAPRGFVFGSRRGLYGLDVAMRSVCQQLGVEKSVTPHDLRRTHGTKITGLGFGRDAMNRVQNHREGGIGSVYDRHEYQEENKKVMEAVAARIMALAKAG